MVRATALKKVNLKEKVLITEKTRKEEEKGWKKFIRKITGGKKNEQ